MSAVKKEKRVIGRSDRIDLPLMDLNDLDAKIDTGAALSTLHCHHNIEVVEAEDRNRLHFQLLDPTHKLYNGKDFYFEQYEVRTIRNSFGVTESRYTIETDIVLFGNSFRAFFTLTDREDMKFPVLLGRQLLRQGFIVDVARKDLSYKWKQKHK